MKEVVDLVFHPSPSLERLYLELTNRCNLACEMCYRQAWQEPLGDMSPEVISKLAEEVQIFPDLKEVVLGGIGEPTLAKQFAHALAEFAPRYNVTVTSNGSTFTPELGDLLLAMGVSKIALSVDSVDQATFEHIRHQNVNTVLGATSYLTRHRKHRKPEIIWEFLAMQSTVPYLVDTVRQAAELGVDKIYVSHLLPMTEEMVPETLYQNFSSQTEKIFLKALQLALLKKVELVLPKNKLKTDRHCKFVETRSAVVRWDGEVAPCYRFLHSYPEYVFGRYKEITAHSFGSIERESLLAIWTKPEFMSYRYKVLHGGYPSCTDCELVDGCDMVLRADMDCLGNEPSCGDCLWGRGITFCP